MSHRPLALLVAVLLLPVAPGLARADLAAREATVSILKELPAKDSGIELRAWVNDGSGAGTRVGDSLQYHFETARDAYLTAVHVDAHGVATVLYPSRATGDPRILAGREKQFPGPDDGFEIHVEPPLGLEDLFAVATLEPVPAEALGLPPGGGDPVTVLPAAEAAAFAKRLRDLLAERAENEIAFAHMSQRVSGRADDVELSAEDIVVFYTTRTRAIRRPRLNLHIRFDSGSADVGPESRAQLDEIGRALGDERLASARFVVGGHTDAVGENEYNLELSRRRADAVRTYLARNHDIGEDRLDIRAFGESRPVEPNDSDDGRFANRRVEFRLER